MPIDIILRIDQTALTLSQTFKTHLKDSCMYPGIKAKDYTDLRDVIATYLLRESPTVDFTNAVLDSDVELVEEIMEFGSYDTMTREMIFEACSQFLLNQSFPWHSHSSTAVLEKFDKDLKKAYSNWVSDNS